MIRSFKNRSTEDVFNGVRSKGARATCPVEIWDVAIRKLEYLDAVIELRELKAPPRNRLEALKGARAGQHSVRINGQYRICFRWTDAGPEDVEIVDYH